LSPIDENAVPDCKMRLPDDWDDVRKLARSKETVQNMLAGLDMKIAPTVPIPREWSADPAILGVPGQQYARSDVGGLSEKRRSTIAHDLNAVMWTHLSVNPFLKEQVRAKMLDTTFVTGGTEYAIGRLQKHYPKKGSTIPEPISSDEAAFAFVNCGYDPELFMSGSVKPYPLLPADSNKDDYVKANKIADNGFPVGLTLKDEGAKRKVYMLAQTVRKEIVEASKLGPIGVQRWHRDKEAGQPWLVTVKAKAKNDYISSKKVFSKQMRLYFAFPKQVLLNMQVVVQPFQATQRNILNADCHTMYGASLAHGGADKLFRKLQEQLERVGYAYVHSGDDGLMFFVDARGTIHAFEFDFSSMDITEHRDAFFNIHDTLRRWMERIDAPAANLWFSFTRRRRVALVSSMTRDIMHGGPSGLPAQSTINDMGSDVFVQRCIRHLNSMSTSDIDHQQTVIEQLQGVGARMGLVVKIENYQKLHLERESGRDSPVRGNLYEFMQQHEMKFIGYQFYATHGKYYCYVDIPRMMAQLPYNRGGWVKKGREFEIAEAIRLGSIVMNIGYPPDDLIEWHQAAVRHAVGLLDKTMAKWPPIEGDDERTAEYMDKTIQGVSMDDIKSMKGLRRAVARDPAVLWLDPKEGGAEELSEFSAPGVPGQALAWADDDEDVVKALRKLRIPARATEHYDDAVFIGDAKWRQPGTRPANLANDGRTPPTAVWVDKAQEEKKRGAFVAATPHSRKYRGNYTKVGRVLEEDSENEVIGGYSSQEIDDYGTDDDDQYDQKVTIGAVTAREEDALVDAARASESWLAPGARRRR